VGGQVRDTNPSCSGGVQLKFKKLRIAGAVLIDIEPLEDERGFFARTYCRNEMLKAGIDFTMVQSSISYNKHKGTLRGMHYQASPYEESKIVSCLRGAIYDVVIDLRPDSTTHRDWISLELDASHYQSVVVPKGCAHGFQTLLDDTVVHYQMDQYYHPEAARGIRWNDPLFRVAWPEANPILSLKDSSQGERDE